ncbi:MAG TPA: glycosyltransferase family 4 protein [Ilumatobacter sp.]|nr:glycosyltransferase family 4 protein [Ilumatobacter sp.]
MIDRRVGYVVSRFPKTTETFILREMQAVERLGWHVDLFAIKREQNEISQPGASVYADRLVAISDVSVGSQVAEQARLARSNVRLWLRLWSRTMVGNWRSPATLVRAMVIAFGAPAIARRVREQGVQHLHAHWGTHSALLAHLTSLLTGATYSVTLHAHDMHVQRSMLRQKLEAATAVVTISKHNAYLLRELYPSIVDRLEIVHCGVDTSKTIPRGASALNDPLRVVCVAGLRPFKGHRHLIHALAELGARGRSVTCDLVGDGPIRQELEAQSTTDVTFHGALDVDSAMTLVSHADVFVMPSIEMANGRRDGIPVALMEAMAIGVPVIASDVSGIPELVRHEITGLLVPPCDPTAIADAIERIIDDDLLRRRLTIAGRRLVERRFDISASGAAMTELFENALHDRPAHDHDDSIPNSHDHTIASRSTQ